MTRPAGTPSSRGRQQRFAPIIVASEAGRVKDNFPRIGLAAPSRLADLLAANDVRQAMADLDFERRARAFVELHGKKRLKVFLGGEPGSRSAKFAKLKQLRDMRRPLK